MANTDKINCGDFMGFPIVMRSQADIDRETMKAKRIEISGGLVMAQGADGTIFVSEPKGETL